MNRDQVLMVLGVGGLLGVVAWWCYADSYAQSQRGGGGRMLSPSAVTGAALDDSLGRVTPDHLLWYGPTMRPLHWSAHRLTYPVTPGVELERLIHGAPGAAVTGSVPRELRGWLFAPPAEVDY